MTTWATAPFSQQTKDKVAALSQQLGGPNNAAALFTRLCNHSRANFTYVPSAAGSLSQALDSRLFNCENMSDLFILIWLHRGNVGNAHPHGVRGGNRSVVTPRIMNAGIRVQNNVQGGNNRMLFTSGHTVASIGGTHYDVISGLSAANLDNQFILCNRTSLNPPTYQCTVGATNHTFVRIGKTGNGLSEFRANPQVTH